MSRFCRCVFKNYWERKSRIYRSACIIWQILKFKTRDDRASGIQIPYKIEDDTNIENITSEKFLSHVHTKRDFKKYLVAKLLKCLQLLRNDILFPTELLLNQTLSIFQTNWNFIHMRKLTVLLYYSVLILPKVIHFVNYMWHVQTQISSFYCCTFTRRHVIILYFMLLHKRLKLDVHTMH